jgi:hypothetical protein
VKREGEAIERSNSGNVVAKEDNSNVQALHGTENLKSGDDVARVGEDASSSSSSVDIPGGANSKEDVASALDPMQKNASLESSMEQVGGVSQVGGNSASSSTTPENPIDGGVAVANHSELDPNLSKKQASQGTANLNSGDEVDPQPNASLDPSKEHVGDAIQVGDNGASSSTCEKLDDGGAAVANQTPPVVPSVQQGGGVEQFADESARSPATSEKSFDGDADLQRSEDTNLNPDGTPTVVKSSEQHRADTVVDRSKPFDYLPPPFLNDDHESSWINSVMHVMLYCI